MDASSSNQSKQVDHGTRRNTRSTSNQDKDKEAAENSKNSNGSNINKEQDSSSDGTKKKQSERVIKAQNGDVLEYTTEDDITYKPLDSVYLATERPDNPYFICIIQEIKVSKRDNAIVSVKWYYRPTEVPDLVYQMLVKERYNQVEDAAVKDLIMKPDIINRELFIDDRLEATNTYPISCLRGKCTVSQYASISEIQNFELKPDHFFYVFSYSPDTRLLASSKGETRVGPSHQWNASMRGIFQKAEIPDLLDPSQRGYENGRVYEELTWEPKVNKCDLIMCLRAARSLAAFAGVCDGVSPEEGCIVASRDDTTINALRVLFENNGNTRKAIDALVKNPVPVTIESKWTEDQVKRFQRGLRSHGKDFFKIKKELLPMKETGELVEFYYLWKKTQDSLMIRPHHRKHRRQAAMKKASKQKITNAGSGEQTSTEEETEESEESEKEVNYKCKHCETSTSKEWLPGGKEGAMLCNDCRIFFKKYGENRPVIKVEDIDSENETDIDTPPAARSQVPPFLFKPIKEDKVVSNLTLRKPAKSLTKVNSTELKTRTEKPNKRQWSDSDETKVKQEVTTIKLKKPKTEQEGADNHSRPNQDVPLRTSAPAELPNSSNKELPLDQKPFSSPTRISHPPSIIPKNNIAHVSTAVPYPQGKVPDLTKNSYHVKKSPTSIAFGPFVSAGQTPLTSSTKPSELEAISKLAMSPGLIPRGIYPTVGYVGAGTPPTLSSQSSTSGQTTSTYSLSGSTTVTTTTNTIRSSPTVEQASGSRPRTSEVEHPGHSRLATHDRSGSQQNQHGSRLSPHPRIPDDGEKLRHYHHEHKIQPHGAPPRNPSFPFDPRVTDQIISNANLSRTIKEEARAMSPTRHPEAPHQPHSHYPQSRGSPVLHHIKQESYHNPQNGRAYPHGSEPHHPRPYTQGPNPHGPQHHGSSRYPSHPHMTPSGRSGSPRQGYTAPPQTHRQDDSDVEVIGDEPTTLDNKTVVQFGTSGRFLKVWNRGPNSCFRTDFIFRPDQESNANRAKALHEFKKKESQQQSSPREQQHAPPHKRPRTPSTHSVSSEHEKKRDDKTDVLDRSKREGQMSSSQGHRSTPGHGNPPQTTPTRTPSATYEQHHRPPAPPAAFVSPLPSFGSDTPALRQLQQYASNDMRRNAAEAAMVPVNPLYPYFQLGGMSEAELRERELREVEFREREFRERENRERLAKMGDIKPPEMLDPSNPNLHHLPPVTGLHMGAIPVSLAGQHIATVEQQLLQRQYQAQLLQSLPPGTAPHHALAMAAAANFPPGNPFNPDAYTAERLSAERLRAERLAAEQQYQLELLHHHQHSHVHSHLHLHPPGQPGAPPPPGTPLPLGVPPPPPGLAVGDPLINPYAAAAMSAMNPLAAASGNPLLSPMIRNQQAAAQAALIQQSLAAPHIQAAVAREQAASAAQPHPFSQNLQALHEQHVIENQRARALQEQFLASRYKQ